MPDEEKTKIHPFAGILHPDEDVLWMSTQADTSFWISLKRAIPILGFLPVLPVMKIILDSLSMRYADSFYLIFAISFIGTFFLMLWQYVKEGRSERVYAVTNERLLYRHQQSISTLPLENVQSVAVFKDEAIQDSLSFGPLFPIWLNVENAAQVKSIIEDTQKQRIQALPLS